MMNKEITERDRITDYNLCNETNNILFDEGSSNFRNIDNYQVPRYPKLSTFDNDKGKNRDKDTCCCKEGLGEALNVLLSPQLRNLINLNSFQLRGQNFSTSLATTLISTSNCPDGVITYSDPTEPTAGGLFNTTTLCDLTFVSFQLLADAAGTPVGFTNRDRFIEFIQRAVCSVDPNRLCGKHEEECCCNQGKASFLRNTLGPVNFRINSSATGAIVENVTVIAVTNNVAWFIDSALSQPRAYIACLDQIVQLGRTTP